MKRYFIKNMVCPRCIMVVKGILENLKIPYIDVELGQVLLSNELNVNQFDDFNGKLKAIGFEILTPGKAALVAQIKTAIVVFIQSNQKRERVNLSNYLSDKLSHEYSYLSRLFSSVEGITIEKYFAKQRIERVKELLFYDELTLTQIADEMEFSSVAHLSAQFKKETGMTASEFKNQKNPGHVFLDSI